MGLILSAPSPTPFVRQVGLALYEYDLLDAFSTGAVDMRPKSSWRRVARAARCVGLDGEAFFRRRRVTEVPHELIRSRPGPDLVRTLIAKLDRDGRVADFVWERAEKGFDRWVARSLAGSCAGVYGYEHACRETFARACELGLKRFYDVPSPDASMFTRVLRDELEQFPELRTPYLTRLMRHEPRRTERRHEEWELASLVFVASSFTKAMCEQAGLDTNKVHVLPLGAPPPVQEPQNGGTKANKPVRFLWAGTFSMRKGAHYLIEAWRTLRPGSTAQLVIIGKVELPRRFMSGLEKNVQFLPPVEHGQVLIEMRRSDVLVFPTLFDGFGLVVTEALAQGLPVITTSRAGAADLIRDGLNGWIIAPGDSVRLTEILQKCVSDRSELKAMRPAATETARQWQWHDYRSVLATTILHELA